MQICYSDLHNDQIPLLGLYFV